MKKLLSLLVLVTMIVISACSQSGNEASPSGSTAPSPTTVPSPSAEADSGTFTYQSETGPVEVPKQPKRIVGLAHAPNVLSLGGTLVGVDEWTNKNPLFKDQLQGVAVVSDEQLEKIIELDPDLIIAGSYMKNLDKLSEIAPTVVYSWGKLDYLNQQLEIGKLLNKQAEAQAWIDDFTKRAGDIGKEIKAKHGEDITVSVLETDSKSFYVFGDHWARGTEILHQAMSLNMPEKVKQDALGPGYYTISQEVIPEYVGDFLVLSRSTTADNSYMQSTAWKNMPAVQNNRVIEIDTEASTYSDPITLEYLLNIFKDGFLGK